MKKLKILIADDHPLFRHGVKTLFMTTPEIEVVGEATSGEEVIQLAQKLEPDVILMDLRMPGCNGIEATREIMKDNPNTQILILTMFQDDHSVFAAMKAGAKGYVLKDAEKDDLLNAIKTVGNGGAIFSPGIASRMIDYFSMARPAAPKEAFPDLTEREREVLYLMADGLNNSGIAAKLNISGKTVSNYVTNILNKLQVADREEAIELVKESRLGREDED
ncbi:MULTISPECIES: response regulator transcription factor [Neobacillus]|uniref:Response regulator transcription factor n=1 Tax=Neobacillus citreus TaxID=2833578 RepID=A0A942SUD5_9BACI|nr:response regulator transcription factor [Neobacillus citreus]MCH6265413.1 response regulator transcription factor [Neobacillus citreus]